MENNLLSSIANEFADAPTAAMPEGMAATSPEQSTAKERKARERWKRVLLRVVISLVVIALGIFLVLFCVAKAAQYDSIGAMLNHMLGELALMWERITA